MVESSMCQRVEESICDFINQRSRPEEHNLIVAHLRDCQTCRDGVQRFREVNGLLHNTIGGLAVRPAFTEKTGQRLHAILAQGPAKPHALPAAFEADEADEDGNESAAGSPGLLDGWNARLGGAPWWAVSLALHVLIIALASLVSMAIDLPHNDDAVIMMTELASRPEVKSEDETKKPDAVDALASRDVAATDANAANASDIVVPPDILAKAELGDHFETINPDLPDSHSALGNPDAKMFHSMSGNTEAAGGGGMGGMSLEDVIGVGGGASPGSGGGWGGGNGTGIGVGNGAGRGSFGNRTGGGRKLMVMRHGGSRATESAVDKALQWLAYHQEPDGHWDVVKYSGAKGGDTALTGLALLAFLGAGHTEKVGAYKDNVKRGVEWLRKKQKDNGCYASPQELQSYNHAMAALAMA